MIWYWQWLLLSLESDSVIEEERVVLPALITNAITRIKSACFGNRKGKARRHIPEAILAAKPVGDETHLRMQRLLVTRNRAAFRSRSISSPDQPVSAAR